MSINLKAINRDLKRWTCEPALTPFLGTISVQELRRVTFRAAAEYGLVNWDNMESWIEGTGLTARRADGT